MQTLSFNFFRANHECINWGFTVFYTLLRKKRLTGEATLKGTRTSMKYEVKWKEIFDHKSKRNFDYDYLQLRVVELELMYYLHEK